TSAVRRNSRLSALDFVETRTVHAAPATAGPLRAPVARLISRRTIGLRIALWAIALGLANAALTGFLLYALGDEGNAATFWELMAQQPAEGIAFSLSSERDVVLVIAAAVITVAGFLALVLSRSVARPLRAITA